MRTSSRVLPNQYTLKKYNDNSYKLILFKGNRLQSGYEEDREKIEQYNDESVPFQKHENNISRIRSKIWEYAECNDFDYFMTLTLNKDKMNRYDLDEYIKKLGQYIRNNRKKTGMNIQYLLIPEKHKDGAYHMHGLIKGLDQRELERFTVEDHLPQRLKELIGAGRKIYNWVPYNQKFGFNTLEPIKNRTAINKYITKYIKKDLALTVTEKGRKAYFVSRDLKHAEILKKETFPTELGNVLKDWDYENEYIKILDLDHEQLQQFIDLL